MEITFDKKSDSHGFIKLTVQEVDYKSEVTSKIKEYARTASIKGFRPGKAPLGLIKKMVGKDLKLDIVSKQVSKSLFEYIEKQELNIIGQPLSKTIIDEHAWKNNKDFDFNFEVGFFPPFEINLDENLPITSYSIEVSEEDIEETITNLKKKNQDTSHPEVSEEGDFVYGKIVSTNGQEYEVDTLIPLNQVEEAERPQFYGLKKDDVVTFDISLAFPEMKKRAIALGIEEEDAEKLTDCTFTLESVTRYADPELNEAFFEKVLGQEAKEQENFDEAAFRAKIKDILAESYQKESQSLKQASIQKTLLDTCSIDISKDFLNSWFEYLQANKENALSDEKEQENYLNSLRWSAILGKLAKEHNIEVTQSDIEVKAKEDAVNFFKMLGMPTDNEDQLNNFANMFLSNDTEEANKKRFEYRQSALQEKVFDVIYKQITLDEKQVTSKEFASIVKEFNEAKEVPTESTK